MSPTGRDIDVPSAAEERDPPLSLLLGIDLEEIYLAFSDLAVLTDFYTVESPLVTRKVQRTVSLLLKFGVPATLVEMVEHAAVALRPATAGCDQRLTSVEELERTLERRLDQVMYRVREHLAEPDRSWYDVGVMLARIDMCQHMVTAFDANPKQGPEIPDHYERELARAIPIATDMLRSALDSSGALLGTDTRTSLEQLFGVLAEEAPEPSDRLRATLAEVFDGLGMVVRLFGKSPSEEPDDLADEPDDWERALAAKRTAALTLQREGRLEEADRLYVELLDELRPVVGMSHHLCLHVQLARCWVLAALGRLRLAVDIAHDAVVSVAFTHKLDDPDAIDIQVRSLQFLLTNGETTEANMIRTEYLNWLEEANLAELGPALRTAKTNLVTVLDGAAKMDRIRAAARRLGELKEQRGGARTIALTRLHEECGREFGTGQDLTLRVAFELAEALIDDGKLRRAARVAERTVSANDETRAPDESVSVLTYVRAWWVLMRTTKFGPRLIELIQRIRWLETAERSELHGELREAYDWYHSIHRIMDEF